jgi:hypothetical protein
VVPRRRQTLFAGLAAAVVLAGVAYLVARDPGDDAAAVSASAGTTTPTTGPVATPPPTVAVDAATASTAMTPSTVRSSSAAAPTSRQRRPWSSSKPVPTTPPTTVAPLPAFQSSIEGVTAAQLGASWRAGCPLGPDQLRAVNLSYVGYDGAAHAGRVIVDAAQAERIVVVFRDLYVARFPIQRIEPVDRYRGDDQASMRAHNTSGFNCRYVAGTTKWSEHSYGRAVDVNPLVNPYVQGTSVDPPEGAPYADRSRTDQGMIHADDAAVQAFARQGWIWGGTWSGGKDYQHFSSSGR